MNSLPKNKNVLIAGAVAVLLIFVAGYLLFFNKPPAPTQVINTTTEIPVLTIDADEIGLTLVQNAAGNRATMKITKTDGLQSVEFQFTYFADVDGQNVQRGTTGEVEIKNEGQAITEELLYGTCSDVCHYDTGIKDVKLIVKVTKSDGKVYQAEVTPSE